MQPTTCIPTQYPNIHEYKENILTKIQSCSRKQIGYATLNIASVISGIALMTIAFPMLKGYNDFNDPQSRITAFGVVLLMTGDACVGVPLILLFIRCCCPHYQLA